VVGSCECGNELSGSTKLGEFIDYLKAGWMFVCCECCVLSARGFCDGLIIRSEESYRLWHVAVCDQVTSYARRLKPDRGL
jgi:hypothetical protein